MKIKPVLITLDTIIFAVLIYIMIINFNSNTTSQFSFTQDGSYIVLSTFFVIILVYCIGVLSGFVYSIVLGERYRDQIEFYARKTEKLTQQNEIDTDDKEALQRKIASLEIALDNALKNKQ